MKELILKAQEHFRNKVNLLLVDDDRHILSSLERNFTSPAFKVAAIDTYNDAQQAVGRKNRDPWHCWVLDVDLGEGKTGIDVMKADSRFPFVLILSGLQSMRVASEAVKQGALAVFDKDPDSLERLYNETCKIAALGYLLGGTHTQYLSTYRLLCDAVLTTPEQWAEKACVSLRQLHRICDIHPVTTPRSTLALYYALYLLLWKGKEHISDALPPGIKPGQIEYFSYCIEYCLKKF
jgi:hypothetical protein